MSFDKFDQIITILISIVLLLITYDAFYADEETFYSSTTSGQKRFKTTNPDDVTTLYKLLYILDKIFQENNLEYWLKGGTMLGAVRHEGIIPWDDDGDVGIWKSDIPKLKKLKKEFKKYGVVMMNTWFGFKIFFTNGRPIKGYRWLYPAVDIFPMKKLKNGRVMFSYPKAKRSFGHCTFDYDKMYPLEKYKFGSFEMSGISHKNVKNYFDRCYGDDWADYAYQMFDHQNEKPLKKTKVKLTFDERLPAMPIDFDKTDI